MLVSFAIGALLGAAFLEVIPHAFEEGEPHQAAAAILGGIFAFFVLEKLLLWRHCHTENCEVHDPHDHGRNAAGHDHGRSGVLIVVGDTVHNFVDGVLIAAAFLQSTELGIITAIAIIAHEIPQEVGDFLILLHSGYSRARALAMNLLSSVATMVGGVLGYFTLQRARRACETSAARHRRGEHDLRRGGRPHSRPAPPPGAARHRCPGVAHRARHRHHRARRRVAMTKASVSG